MISSLVFLLFICSIAFAFPTPSRSYDFNSTLSENPYFFIEWSFTNNDSTIEMAIFCENSDPSVWCGIGLSKDGTMVNLPQGWTDGVIGYIDQDGTADLKDFRIANRLTPPGPSFGRCPNSICPDVYTYGCQDNVIFHDASRDGNIALFEFSRPVAASDSCDAGIFEYPDITFAIGSSTFDNLMEHIFKNSLLSFSWNPKGGPTHSSQSIPITTGTTGTTGESESTSALEDSSSGFLGLPIWVDILILVGIIIILGLIIGAVIVVIYKKKKKKDSGNFY